MTPIDLKSKTEVELKALAYDCWIIIEKQKLLIASINDELNLRMISKKDI